MIRWTHENQSKKKDESTIQRTHESGSEKAGRRHGCFDAKTVRNLIEVRMFTQRKLPRTHFSFIQDRIGPQTVPDGYNVAED